MVEQIIIEEGSTAHKMILDYSILMNVGFYSCKLEFFFLGNDFIRLIIFIF